MKHLFQFVILICAVEAAAGSENAKKSYEVTIVVQTAYVPGSDELGLLQQLIKELPKKKNKPVIGSITIYRSDNGLYKTFDYNSINYSDPIFISGNEKNNCEVEDIQRWFDCAMKNYPLDKDFTRTIVLNSNFRQTVDYLSGTDRIYPVYTSPKQLIDALGTFKKFGKSEKVLLLHYFSNPPPKTPVTKCDTISQYIEKHSLACTPKLDSSRSAIIPTTEMGYNVYKLSWNNIALFDGYKLKLDSITFNVVPFAIRDLDEQETSLEDFGWYSYVDKKNKVVCLIGDNELGRRCVLAGYGKNTDEADCPECQYSCLYERLWNIKVAGTTCDDVTGDFSNEIEVQLMCQHSNLKE